MNNKLNAWLLLVVSAFVLISCEKNEPVYDVEIVTDASSYTLSDSLEISVTLSNNSDSTIYYICTCQIYLEELKGQALQNSWLVHGFEECLAPVAIATGTLDTFQIDLGFLHEQGHLDAALFDSSVDYRLRFDLFEEKNFKTMLDGSNILSNRFLIAQ